MHTVADALFYSAQQSLGLLFFFSIVIAESNNAFVASFSTTLLTWIWQTIYTVQLNAEKKEFSEKKNNYKGAKHNISHSATRAPSWRQCLYLRQHDIVDMRNNKLSGLIYLHGNLHFLPNYLRLFIICPGTYSEDHFISRRVACEHPLRLNVCVGRRMSRNSLAPCILH